MTPVRALGRWVWGRLLAAGGLVLPMVGGLRSSAAFWALHALVVLAGLAGLAWLGHRLDLPRYVRAPAGWLAHVWLPGLALLAYLNLWLGYWLWALLRAGPRPSPFPDLDAGWRAVRAGLDRAGLDLARVPVVLVLGRPRDGLDPVFADAGLTLNPVGGADAAVRAFAGPAAVFVAAPGCGLTAGLADWADRLDPPPRPAPVAPAATGGLPSLLAPVEGPPEPADEPDAPPPTKNPAELARLDARLRHLCGLIRHSRRPYCPANGLLVLVPEAASRSAAAAGMAGLLVRRDLDAVREGFQLDCPAVGVLCDADRLPGFADFLQRLPADRRTQRFGRKLPYAPRLDAAERAGLIADAVRWTCRELAPRLACRVMPLSHQPAGESDELVRLGAELDRRQDALARLFADGLAGSWAGGCYLAGTGRTADRRGFLADVLGQLVESQNLVAWTPAARQADRRLDRRTAAGYAGVAVAAAAVGWLAVRTVWR